MLFTVIEVILLFVVPFFIMRWRSSRLVSLIGTVGVAYLAGMLFSLIASVVFPARDTAVSEILVYVSIALAIPLLLFSNNIKNVLKLSRITLLSFLLLVVSVITASALLFFLYTRRLDGGAVLSGMAVALYTGGTPNLNAVACLFRLDNDLILTANLSDLLFGGVFYLFLIFGAKPLLSKFLKNGREAQEFTGDAANREDIQIPFSLRSKGVLRNLLLSLLILLASFGAGLLIWAARGMTDGTMTDYAIPALMIGCTVGGILLSFHPKVSTVRENELLGRYFAAVFSYAIASIIDIGRLGSVSPGIFVIYAGITITAFILHALLCRLFHIGADTMIITSTAGIYGPAFIPSISKAIHADYLLASGLIMGSFGYAIGTFLGVSFTCFLGLF